MTGRVIFLMQQKNGDKINVYFFNKTESHSNKLLNLYLIWFHSMGEQW